MGCFSSLRCRAVPRTLLARPPVLPPNGAPVPCPLRGNAIALVSPAEKPHGHLGFVPYPLHPTRHQASEPVTLPQSLLDSLPLVLSLSTSASTPLLCEFYETRLLAWWDGAHKLSKPPSSWLPFPTPVVNREAQPYGFSIGFHM